MTRTKYLFFIKGNEDWGYDEYSDFVVCAETEELARVTHPSQTFGYYWNEEEKGWFRDSTGSPGSTVHKRQLYMNWPVDPKDVSVTLLGTAQQTIPLGVVCASFHAG